MATGLNRFRCIGLTCHGLLREEDVLGLGELFSLRIDVTEPVRRLLADGASADLIDDIQNETCLPRLVLNTNLG